MQCFTALEKNMYFTPYERAQNTCLFIDFTLFHITLHVILQCATYGQPYERVLTTTVIELVSSLIGRG